MNNNKQDFALRPTRLSEYGGQEAIVGQLALALESANMRGATLDHVLLDGGAGLGKTTLANIIANECGGLLVTLNAAAIKTDKEMIDAIIGDKEIGWEMKRVIFMDEIHRLPIQMEEVLYEAMEDGKISITDPTLRMPLPPLTLIGATTLPGNLSSPFRARFGLKLTLNPYRPEAIAAIITHNASLLGVGLDGEAVGGIVSRARGVPRLANHLLRRCRDHAITKGDGTIRPDTVAIVMDILGLDSLGLDGRDRKYLSTIIDRYDGGPVGVEAVGSGIGEDTKTLTDVCEPYLMSIGLLIRGRRGRETTALAARHLNGSPSVVVPKPVSVDPVGDLLRNHAGAK